MEEINIIRKVTKDGISIKNPRLRKYINQKVKLNITINPVSEEKVQLRELEDIINSFTDDDVRAFSEALADCRRIDYNEWD
jgi:hypothetical protein